MEKTVRFQSPPATDNRMEAVEDTEHQIRPVANGGPHQGRTVPAGSSAGSDNSHGRWRNVAKQVRNAVMVKNAVKPSRLRRKSTWRSPETVDPFIQKFSTRENRKTTPPKRRTSRILRKNSSGDIIVNVNTDSCASTIDKELESDISGTTNLYGTEFGWSCFHRDRPLIFDPDGLFNYFWFYFLVFSIRYNLWSLIVRIAFPDAQFKFRFVWFVFDYLCDFLYVLDLLICSCTGFLEEGILVNNRRRVFMRYVLSKEFVADVISIIPVDLLYLWLGARPELRLNRLVKSYKSFKLKSAMESQAQFPTFLRVFFLLHLMFLLIHWNAAIYYMISRAEGFGTNDWVYPGNGSIYQQYLQSFYWSTLTLTAIGDLPAPTTNLEFVYTIICYLTGVFMFATIVGNAGSIIVNSDASRVGFEKQRENTKHYMKKHNVPKDLQRRVIMWYDYSWTRGRMSTGGGDLNSITLLPDKLKTEIALHVNLETLSKVTFLQKCQPEFLHDLVLKMKLRIFTPGDLICRKGEPAREMYVIISGVVEVIGDAGQVLKVLRGGDFFGEIGILSLSEGQNRRTAVVRTVGYVESFVLSKDDVLSAIRDYPEAQAVLAEYGRKRLQRQNTADDPRLVDMEDYNENAQREKNENNSAEHSYGNRTRETQKRSSQDIELIRMPKRSRPPPMYLLRSPTPRGQLEPISPHVAHVDKGWGDSRPITVSASEPDLGSYSDSPVDSHVLENNKAVSTVLGESFTDCLTNLQQVFERKLEQELHGMKAQIKSLELKMQKKKEKITSLKERLHAKDQETEDWREKITRLEAENAKKQAVIDQMQETISSASLKSKRKHLVNMSTSMTSLLDEADTQC